MSSMRGVSRAADEWSWSKEATLPNDAVIGRQFTEEFFERLQAEHWPNEQIEGIRLAIEEALVNAVSHGNGGDCEKQVFISCKLSPGCARVEIADQGCGFNPENVADPTLEERLAMPHGRGLLLMRHFMCRVQYNELGNTVVMEKFR